MAGFEEADRASSLSDRVGDDPAKIGEARLVRRSAAGRPTLPFGIVSVSPIRNPVEGSASAEMSGMTRFASARVAGVAICERCRNHRLLVGRLSVLVARPPPEAPSRLAGSQVSSVDESHPGSPFSTFLVQRNDRPVSQPYSAVICPFLPISVGRAADGGVVWARLREGRRREAGEVEVVIPVARCEQDADPFGTGHHEQVVECRAGRRVVEQVAAGSPHEFEITLTSFLSIST